MKNIVPLVTLLFLSCADVRQNTPPDEDDTVLADRIIAETNLRISRCDTIIDYPKYSGHMIRCYDDAGKMVKADSVNLYESNLTRSFHYTKIYDSRGRLIYERRLIGVKDDEYTTYSYDTINKQIEVIVHDITDSFELRSIWPLSDSFKYIRQADIK